MGRESLFRQIYFSCDQEFNMKTKRVPRNPYVALAKFRQAGAHTKPTKSVRRQDKQSLAQAVRPTIP
jgi:hypothetical protein